MCATATTYSTTPNCLGLAALVLKYKAESNNGSAQNLAIRDTTTQILDSPDFNNQVRTQD
jgi:hypothetical protein